MEVTCQRCGAGVPAGNAFCAECGAVMFEGAPRERREDPSSQLSATISGAYPLRDLPAPEPTPARAAKADARGHATPARADVARSRSTLFLVVGVAAMVALGVLLFYLVGLIMRG